MYFHPRHPCVGSLEADLNDTKRPANRWQAIRFAAWVTPLCLLAAMIVMALTPPPHTSMRTNVFFAVGLLFPVMQCLVLPRVESRCFGAMWRHEDVWIDLEIIRDFMATPKFISPGELVQRASVSLPAAMLLHAAVEQGARIELSEAGWMWVRVTSVPENLNDAMRAAGFTWVSHTSRTWIGALGRR